VQCIAVCCSVLQCVAVHLYTKVISLCIHTSSYVTDTLQHSHRHTATHCNTPQHTNITHCNKPLHQGDLVVHAHELGSDRQHELRGASTRHSSTLRVCMYVDIYIIYTYAHELGSDRQHEWRGAGTQHNTHIRTYSHTHTPHTVKHTHTIQFSVHVCMYFCVCMYMDHMYMYVCT